MIRGSVITLALALSACYLAANIQTLFSDPMLDTVSYILLSCAQVSYAGL